MTRLSTAIALYSKRNSGSGNRQQRIRQQATGNRQQATGNRQQATGNRQLRDKNSHNSYTNPDSN
ncbi:hypothetical protein [Moorena bouillonii]|uniref:hypothetical protein n=1 Tax=Moorena bouillonii TaxID=207920 RepID=UPI0013019304|nr:hypothetical protein [Moorena bouillonii]